MLEIVAGPGDLLTVDVFSDLELHLEFLLRLASREACCPRPGWQSIPYQMVRTIRMASSSFYGPVPETPRDDLLADYLRFLERRNGTIDAQRDYPHREAWLDTANSVAVRYDGAVDEDLFERSWTRFDPAAASQPALVSLLAFVKVNAGEAYGVEAVSKARHGQPVSSDLFDRVERVLGKEETYHTRILLGATRQFGVGEPKGAWTPPLAVRTLIGALVHAPKSLFHPVLLGAEVGGIFTFNWMLRKVRSLFADHPKVRATLEERLMEILIDEIGHVAFNRLAVGPRGMAMARKLAPEVAHRGAGKTPEFQALGWSSETVAEFERFDLASLPEEARRRAFFV